VKDQLGELIPLREVAARLHVEPARLRRLSLRGDFPALLRVTRSHYLVRRDDLEAWQAGRWTTESAARAALVAEAVRGGVVNRRRRTSAPRKMPPAASPTTGGHTPRPQAPRSQ
jgi:hypothetical protein